MDFDLADLDTGGTDAGVRSSKFNPRLKPRARPRPKAADAAKAPDAVAATPATALTTAPANPVAAPLPAAPPRELLGRPTQRPALPPHPATVSAARAPVAPLATTAPRASHAGYAPPTAAPTTGLTMSSAPMGPPSAASAPTGLPVALSGQMAIPAPAPAAQPDRHAAVQPARALSGAKQPAAAATASLASAAAAAARRELAARQPRRPLLPLLMEPAPTAAAPVGNAGAKPGRKAPARRQPARSAKPEMIAASAAGPSSFGYAEAQEGALSLGGPETDASYLPEGDEYGSDDTTVEAGGSRAGKRKRMGRARTKASEKRARKGKGGAAQLAVVEAVDGDAEEELKKPPRRLSSSATLAATELDVNSMSLKEVIRWSNARERVLLAEERRLRKESGLPEVAAEPARRSDAHQEPQAMITLAPQVTMGADGQIVMNEATLTVQAQPEGQQERRTVLSDQLLLNSQSYAVGRSPNERWSEEETENFFRALSAFGTDFTLLSQLFPGRSRRQCKNKYTKECKANAQRIDEALKGNPDGSAPYQEILSRLRGETDGSEMLTLEAPPGSEVSAVTALKP